MYEYLTKNELKIMLDNIKFGDQQFIISPYSVKDKSIFDDIYNKMKCKLNANDIVYLCYKRDGKYRIHGFHKSEGYLKEVESTLEEIYLLHNLRMTDIFGDK